MEAKMKAVFVVIEGGKLEKPLWRRIGSAFVNGDQSLNVVLDALPVSGRLHIRDVEARADEVDKGVA